MYSLLFLLSSDIVFKVTYPKKDYVVDSTEPFEITWTTNVTDDRKVKIFFNGGPLTAPQWVSEATEFTLSDQHANVAPLGRDVPPARNYTLYFTLKPYTEAFGQSDVFNVNNGTKAIPSSGLSPSTSPSSRPPTSSEEGGESAGSLTQGAKVGIGVGVGLGVPILAALAGMLFLSLMRKRPREAAPSTTQLDSGPVADEALHPGMPAPQYYYDPPPPKDGYLVANQEAPSEPSELGGSTPMVQELPATTTH